MRKNEEFSIRLAAAITGVRHAWKAEKSFRTQTVIGVLAIVVLTILRPGWTWSALVLAMVGMVLMAELFNTALEALCDGLHPQQAEFIRVVKDAAAGAVLVISLSSLVVGLCLLLFLM